MLLSAFRFSGDEVDESQAPRYFGRVGSVAGGFEVKLVPRKEVWRPGEPVVESLDAPGDVKDDVNGAAKKESSRRWEESVECSGGECAELAEDTDESGPSVSTPAASTCLLLSLSPRMLKHGN